jgi:hypothetical protein
MGEQHFPLAPMSSPAGRGLGQQAGNVRLILLYAIDDM